MKTSKPSVKVLQSYACTLCAAPVTAERDDEHALARLCDCCHGLTETEAHLAANNGASIGADSADIVDYIAKMLERGGRMHPLAERMRRAADVYLEGHLDGERMRTAVLAAVAGPVTKARREAEAHKAVADAIRANADALAGFLPSVVFTIETVAHLRGLERELLPMCDAVRKLMGEPMLANAVRS